MGREVLDYPVDVVQVLKEMREWKFELVVGLFEVLDFVDG